MQKSISPLFAGLALALAALLPVQLFAAVLYWDSNATTTGAGGTPTGTWGTSNFWNTDATGGAAGAFQTATVNTDDLYFVAGPGAASGNSNYTVTVSGSQFANSLNFQASGNTTISGGTLITLGDGTSGHGGINIPQYAYGTTNNGAVTISTALTLNNTQTWTNNSASTLTMQTGALSLGAYALTVTGSGNTTISSAVSGTGGSIVKNGNGVLTLSTANSFALGTTLNAGTLAIANATAVGAATSTLTLNGGTLRSTNTTAYTLAQVLSIGGSTTFGDFVNNGILTFSSTSQNITTPVTLTNMSANNGTTNTVIFGTGQTWGSNAITYRGPGQFGLQSTVSTATNTGAVSIGDFTIGTAAAPVSAGSLGGRISLGTQTAMGSGAYAINYGGTLAQSAAFNPTNVITINNGGNYAFGGGGPASSFAAGSVINSGATITNTNSNTLTVTTPAAAPATGVIFFNLNSGNGSNVAFSGSYPALTGGTLAIGGVGLNGTTTNYITTSATTSVTGDTTLALNMIQNEALAFNGLSLSANLTIAGGNSYALTGAVPQTGGTYGANVSNLGNITSSGTRSLTINMQPTGAFGIGYGGTSNTLFTTSYTGGTFVNGGYLSIGGFNNGTSAITKYAGGASSTGITLNGGWVRVLGNNGSGSSSDNIAVGPNGGGLDSFSSNSSPNQGTTFSGNITKSGLGGVLTLRYGGQGTSGLNITLSGSNSGFDTGFTLATTNGMNRAQFNTLASLGSSGSNAGGNTAIKNVITAPNGVLFGFDGVNLGNNVTTLQTAMSYFSTSTGSILSLDNISATNIDLSNSGGTSLNRDIRLGSSSNTTYTGAITPYASTYNFTPASGGTNNGPVTLSLNQAFQLTGANNLDVATGQQAPGAYGVAYGTLQILNGMDYAGTTSVTGTVLNSLAGGGTQGTTLTVGTAGNLFSTSGITMDKGANLNLAGTVASPGVIGSTGIGITVKGGGTLVDGDTTAANNNGVTNRIASTNTLTLGGNGGGTFTMGFAASGTHAQTLASLTVGAGANTINTVNTAAGALNLTFGGAAATNYVRNAGGSLNFTVPTATTNSVTYTSGVTTITGVTSTNIRVGQLISGNGLAAGTYVVSYNNAGGTLTLSQATVGAFTATLSYQVNNENLIFTNTPASSSVVGGLLVGATVNNGDFVSATGGASIVVPTHAYKSAAATWSSGENIAALGNTAFSGVVPMTLNAFAINSLLSSASGNGTITIGTVAADTLTISTGMFLHTPNNSLAINGPGSLATGNGQDYYLNVGQNTVTIAAKLGSAVALTKVGGGTLAINNSANTVGDVYVEAGILSVGTAVTALGQGGASSAAPSIINLMGGTLQSSVVTGTFSNLYKIIVGPQNGGLQTSTNNTLNFNGDIVLNGRLTVNTASSAGTSVTTLGGTLSGPGALLAAGSNANSNNAQKLTISGSNSGWSGGLILNTGANVGASIVKLDNANAAGTGPIIANNGTSKGNGLYFTNNVASASPTTLTNLISGVLLMTNLATSNSITLTGGLYSRDGLNLQGNAAGGVGSELILAGTTSISGTPLSYNWSGTPTTVVQNFVNGQGGLTVGSTDYGFNTSAGNSTNTLLSTAANYYVPMSIDNASAGKLVQGALGFVRFSGTQSFIPGAVGPGYLAALHKGGDTAIDYGNGLLSGTTGGANNLFGFGLTGTAAGATYALPEGKSFVIGSLGNGAQTGGTLYATGTGTNTAILTGSSKLAGFAAGDVNIHANAVGDTQSLNLSAKLAGDTMQLGTSGTGVVFSPTYGDSGFTTSVALMSTRTGATTINKLGAGTVEVVNAHFNNIGGAAESAKAGFTVNVNAGTLKYTQVDTGGAKYAALNVSAGATLAGIGTINSTTNTVNGIVAPGSSIGTLIISDSVTWNSNDSNDWTFELGTGAVSMAAANSSTDSDLLNILSGAFIKGTDTGVVGYAFNFLNTGSIGWYKLVDFTTNTGGFAGSDFTVSNLLTGTGTFVVDSTTSALYLNVVPEPSTWALLAFSLTAVMAFRRRRA